jgi:hypothetical protein
MAISKNVGKGERVARIILGAILIPAGFSLAGLWKPLSIVLGAFLILTSFVGY